MKPVAYVTIDALRSLKSNSLSSVRAWTNQDEERKDVPLYELPEGYCIVPIDTLKHWRNLGDLNPKDLAPRIDAYIKDNP